MGGASYNERLLETRPMQISQLTLVVRDYDEAVAWFTRSLGFELIEDTDLGDGKRWVVVGARGDKGARLRLARAATPEQQSHIGNQTGGSVFLFLYTDDFDHDYRILKSRGVDFVEEPRTERYGNVVVFRDLYGNRWDFVERRP